MIQWDATFGRNLFVEGVFVGYVTLYSDIEWHIYYLAESGTVIVRGYASKEEAKKDFELMFCE